MNLEGILRLTLSIILILAAGTPPAAGNPAAVYRKWTHANHPVECEVPTAWVDAEGKGLNVVGPGLPPNGYRPRLIVHFYLNGERFLSADTFIDNLTGGDSEAMNKAAERLGIPRPRETRPIIPVRNEMISGRKASRFEKKGTWTRQHPIPGVPLERHPPGRVPVVKAYAIVPVDGGYWVLHFDAAERDYNVHLPHFEHLIKTFRFKQNGLPGAADSKLPATNH